MISDLQLTDLLKPPSDIEFTPPIAVSYDEKKVHGTILEIVKTEESYLKKLQILENVIHRLISIDIQQTSDCKLGSHVTSSLTN